MDAILVLGNIGAGVSRRVANGDVGAAGRDGVDGSALLRH